MGHAMSHPLRRLLRVQVQGPRSSRYVSQLLLRRLSANYCTGTFWYHSHEGLQYCDGLRGPLIVYDPHDPHKHLYDVDDGTRRDAIDDNSAHHGVFVETTVITLADWYHLPAVDLPVPA